MTHPSERTSPRERDDRPGSPGAASDPAFQLIVLAHGSRDPRWRRPFERLTRRLTRTLGAGAVRLAFLEMAAPSLTEAVDAAALEGIRSLRVLPLFLAAGAHVERDIPDRIRSLTARHPGLRIEMLAPVGREPRLVALLETLALEAAGASGVDVT